MTQNKFYGKNLNELNPDELQLLSVDIQLTSLIARGEKAIMQIAQGFKMRTKAVNQCLNMGGDYSRSTFLSENGLTDDNIPMEEIKEVTGMMDDITKHIKGFIKTITSEMKKEAKNEPKNGKLDNGFQMN